MSKAITCINCGFDGEIEVRGLYKNISLNVFKYLGRNHLSGHRHYQCPACGIVLLVDPALIKTSEPLFARKPKHSPMAPCANLDLHDRGYLGAPLRHPSFSPPEFSTRAPH